MKIKYLYLLIGPTLFQIFLYGQSKDVGAIDKAIINTVVQIEKHNEIGSGFLVQMGMKTLLVTNKHVVGHWSPTIPFVSSDSIYVYLYSSVNNERIHVKRGIKISNSGLEMPNKLKVHSNHGIDVAVIDITNDIKGLLLTNTNFVDTTYLIKVEESSKILTYGSKIFAIGYPSGLKAFKSNEPLVKSGHLASSIDGKLVMEQNWPNRNGASVKVLTEGKIFVVDGLIIPGNSGGPVVMSKEVIWYSIGGVPQYLQNPHNFFIGIVSNIYNQTGLTVAFASDNILEVIRKFK